MKDFNEFLASITQEDVSAIMRDAADKASHMKSLLGNDPTSLGTQIGAISYTVALELLGLYHHWLGEDPQQEYPG